MKDYVRQALISVFDKQGLTGFAQQLVDLGIQIISTGATAGVLTQAGIRTTKISQITNFPEMLDGRVKTLHPKIHGAILADTTNDNHRRQLEENAIQPIDMVVVNLYPFEQILEQQSDFPDLIENIDIGGSALLRAAAKNHQRIVVVVDPNDYEMIGEALKSVASLGDDLRRYLAAKAFALSAHYDAIIANWLMEQSPIKDHKYATFTGKLAYPLRYGENPHQKAGFYLSPNPKPGIATAKLIQGKPLSYNNINDANAAFELICEFNPSKHAAAAIIKHCNPCGVAVDDRIEDAYANALACDSQSAFGGIIALNRPLNRTSALAIISMFTEVIIAPGMDDEARELLATKPNIRVLVIDIVSKAQQNRQVKSVIGGLLVQSSDWLSVTPEKLEVVSAKQPEHKEIIDLLFAFRVVKHVKSNGIVVAKNGATVGIGAGQTSRINAVKLAVNQEACTSHHGGAVLDGGAVLASDAFLPFPDAVLAAKEAGITAIIQPGGSLRDPQVIKAADDAGIAMVFTKIRHFRH